MANTDWNTLFSGAAAVNRSGFLTALEKRSPYVVIAGENPASLTPGNVNVIVYGGVLFNYDASDALTAHDGTTCIVTADGKRFKTDQFKGSNNALRNVKDKDLATPPGSPTLGDRYIVAASGTGAWATHDKQVAEYTARGWVFQIPNAFDVTMVVDEALYYHYSAGGAWTSGLPALTIADASISLKKLKYFPLGVSVENQTTNTPPGSPSDGVAYLVAGSPTGAWVGHELDLAIYETSAWVFYDGYEGARVYDKALNALYTHNGATWATPAADPEEYLGRITFAADASKQVFTLNGKNLSAYQVLRLRGWNIRPASDGVGFRIRLSSDGATYITSASYDGSSWGINGGTPSSNSPANSFQIENPTDANPDIGNAAGDGGLNFSLEMLNFNVAQKTALLGTFIFHDTGAAAVIGAIGQSQSAQTVMVGLEFLMTSGNVTSGFIDIWGTP